ncbi:MAG: dUTP diphosphatase [Candidatus Eremiobacteraeota bacterium]|nr:dUTP diphosphatase [Candidatus Eremiobacteraeota bacterium]MBV9647483.1 dUTP diphosphatase [Candidatus Eremiobacteraeota bacterium]
MRVLLKRLPSGAGLPLPTYMTAGSAGADIVAAVHDDLTLLPGARAIVPTGFALALPPGYEAQVRPRSGLALRAGVTLLNAPGTIDEDYRDEIALILANFGTEPYVVRRGERVAQLVVAPVRRATFDVVESLDETTRAGGFGSTGYGAETHRDGGR